MKIRAILSAMGLKKYLRLLRDEINTQSELTTTCVTGYWDVNNKHGNKYKEWFKNTLQVNCPYVIFSDKQGIEMIKQFRKDLPTHYIDIEIKNFESCKYKEKLKTHPIHCPSLELNLIWLEKLFLVERAFRLNPFNTDWFHWIDAGHCIYREVMPPKLVFPNPQKIKKLPKDRVIYSSSEPYQEHLVSWDNYYHHVSGTFMMHGSIVDKILEIYRQKLEEIPGSSSIVTEQVVLTLIYKDNKKLFHKLCDGYGGVASSLY